MCIRDRFLVNALETAALSSLLTIASTSFIEKSPYLSCFKGKEAFPFYFSTFAEEKPYLIRNSAAFSEITSPGITTGTPGGQGQAARAAILPTARFIGTSSLGESTAFLGETACPETGGIRRPMARGAPTGMDSIARSTLRNSSSVLKGEGISTTKPSSAYSGSTPHSRKP